MQRIGLVTSAVDRISILNRQCRGSSCMSMELGPDVDDVQLVTAVIRALPRDAVHHLLSLGVCGRCILALFDVRSPAYSSSLLSFSSLHSIIKDSGESKGIDDDCGNLCNKSWTEPLFCRICLGILQFAYTLKGKTSLGENKEALSKLVESVVDDAKTVGQFDSFCFRIYVPPVVKENQLAVRSYITRKYEDEDWFQEKFPPSSLPVNECLRLSLIDSFKTLLGVESDASSMFIRLVYNYSKKRLKQNSSLNGDMVFGGTDRGMCDGYMNKPDIGLGRVIEEGCDHTSAELCNGVLMLPCRVCEPCYLILHCHRAAVYIGGRYLKFSRAVNQSPVNKRQLSVQEIIRDAVFPICKAGKYKFHAAGREDKDVRVLGLGRPFMAEVVNPLYVPTLADIEVMEEKINNLEEQYVIVRNLKVYERDACAKIHEARAIKRKQYAALIWISRPLQNEDLEKVSTTKDMVVLQKTPVRTMASRSLLVRKRIIHWMKIEKFGCSQYFMLHICAQAGTYIKEFVHGDLGRTYPW